MREKKKRKKNTKSEKKERNEQRGGRARLTNERRSGGWEGRGLDGSTRSSGVGHGAYPRRVSSNENSAASNEFVSSVGGKSERERESSTSSSRDEARSDSLGPRERGKERERAGRGC